MFKCVGVLTYVGIEILEIDKQEEEDEVEKNSQ